jgi:hypothetical protein
MPLLREEEYPSDDEEPSSPLLPSPGKDSSRLMQDLLEHKFADPQIAHHPPRFDPTQPHTSPDPSHTHSFVMKTRESLAKRPWNQYYGDSSIVAICQTCRIYMSLTITLTSEGQPKCGSPESDKISHHFHLERWTSNSRYSASSGSIEAKPEYGSFQCCQCPVAIQIDFGLPIVPEYLLSSVKKRKTGSNSAINLLSRGKDSKALLPTNSYSTLSIYVRDILDKGVDNPDINITPDSPFARRVGLDPDVIRFMEHLGWWQRPDDLVLVKPEWDENTEQGRLRRKRLESAELELAELASQYARGIEKADLFRIAFFNLF